MQSNLQETKSESIIHQISKFHSKHLGRKSLLLQEKELFNFESLSDAEINNEKYLFMLSEVMKKTHRNLLENQIILRHLMHMTHFTEMIKDQKIDLSKMIIMISDCIRYRFVDKNRVLFKVGERGDNFYIILKGKVDILVCNEIKVKFTEGDYILYLSKLRVFEEYEILHKIILMNKTTFPIDFDNFDFFVKKCIDIILDIMNLSNFNNGNDIDEDDISRIYNSPQNNKFTNRSILYALLSKEIKAIYNEICKVDEVTLMSNYMEKVNKISNANSRKESLTKVSQILNNSDSILNSDAKSINNKKSNKNSNVSEENFKNIISSCSTEEYISRIKVSTYQSNPSDQSENPLNFNIIQYNFLLNLSTGSVFGEKAFMANSTRRTATIITNEESHLGVISKEIYCECIREVDEKIKKQNISLLLSSYLFKDFSRNSFDKKYFNFFIHKRISRGQKLVTEGKIPEGVFFIKEGEFDVTVKSTLNDLTNLIKTLILGGMNKDFSLRKHFYTPEINEKELLDALKNHSHTQLYDKFSKFFNDNLPFGEVESDNNLAKYLSEKRIFKISQISKRDIVGFEDFICNDINVFSVECTSIKGHYFMLNFNFLKSIANGEKITKDFYESFVNSKKDCLIDRLINIRKMYMEKYKKNKIYETQRKIENDELQNQGSPLRKVSNLGVGKLPPGAICDSPEKKQEDMKKGQINNLSARLSFIKNLQELRIKNEKAQLLLKETLSPKRNVKKRKAEKIQQIENFNLYRENDDLNNNFQNNKENENFPNIKNPYNNELRKSMYLSNNMNLIKTSFDFGDKTNFFSTINDGMQSSSKGNFFFTHIPIFKVDYSQNFYNSNTNFRYSNNLVNNNLMNPTSLNFKITSNDSNSFIKFNSFNNIQNSDELGKNYNGQNTFNNYNNNNIDIKYSKNANLIKIQNEFNDNNIVNINVNENLNFLPKINIENQTSYNSVKRPFRKNEFSSSNNIHLKKNSLNRLTNYNVKSFSNSNIYESTLTESLNSNNLTKKHNSNNLASTFNNEQSKNVLVGTTGINFNVGNPDKFEKKRLKMDFNPTMSTEENEILSNLCNYNKYELKMDDKNQENIYYNKEEKLNHKKKPNKKISYDNSNDKNNQSIVKELNNKLGTNIHFKRKYNLYNKSSSKLKVSQTNYPNMKESERIEKLNSSYRFLKTDKKISHKNSDFKKNLYMNEEVKINPYDESKHIQNNSKGKKNQILNEKKNQHHQKEPEIKIQSKFEFESEKPKEDEQINLFNSTKEIFRKANTFIFTSQKKNKMSRKYLSCKYNINASNSLSNYYEFLDEKDVCKLIIDKIIKINDLDKLNLTPNFNKSYFQRLLNFERNNTFNNPLLEKFKPENYKNNIPDEYGMESKKKRKHLNQNEDETNIQENCNSNYRETETSCNEEDLMGEVKNNEELDNQEIPLNETNENQENTEENFTNENNYTNNEDYENDINNIHGNLNTDKVIMAEEYNSNNNFNTNNYNENTELNNISIENEEVGELLDRKDYNYYSVNHNHNSEKMLSETLISENYMNNLGASTIDNYHNFHRLQQRISDNYKEENYEEKVPYNWGTKYSNIFIAPGKFLKLNNNMANSSDLKTNLLSNIIVDQHKLSNRRKEQFILKKEMNSLARTQKVFSKFIQKRKGTLEKK